jgi:rhamnosyltransferase
LSLPAPRVLILLASYNGGIWIQEQLNSILNQSNVALRIIVRDDASVDGTADVVRRTSLIDPRVELKTASTTSGSAAQNFFSLIRDHDAKDFDYIALSDQDDIWEEDKLGRATDILSKSGACGCSTAVTAVWPNGGTRLLRQNPHLTEADFLFEGAGQGCTFVMTSALYSRLRTFFHDHPPLTQEIHYHDWTIYALTRAWRLPWYFDPKSSLQYRQHRNNDTGARGTLDSITTRLARISNGWYRQQLILISAVSLAAAPQDLRISQWHILMRRRPSLTKRLDTAFFCLRRGRRRASDNVILVLSAILGWI